MSDEREVAAAVAIEGDRSGIVRMTSRGPIITGNSTMLAVLAVLDRVAASTCTVLVTGESGTGKELAVAALHDASPRAERPLVAVNCGAIPENLVESELFGHVRGAFTGANGERKGVVAAAEGGTLFLDEVAELPLAAQVKLLRLLQAREYTPVGESRARKADVRIVAATHRDLAAEVAAGRFREDLYYRLDVIHVHLPALRERREDIPLLAEHFLLGAAGRCGRAEVVGFEAGALACLVAADWAGNIRALENAVERAVLLSPGPMVPALTVEAPRAPRSGPRLVAAPATRGEEHDDARDAGAVSGAIIDLRAAVEEYENRLIRAALDRARNNKTRAAALLGLQRTTFVEMLKRKRIEPPARAA